MRVYLLRHGRTAYNDAQRYQGLRDIPLSQMGEEELRPAEEAPETVYVSPLSRARRTAELLFPHARQVPVEGFREMDFGAFEGRNYKEMEHDAAYRAWVEGGCEGTCPGGDLGWSREELEKKAVWDVQDLAPNAEDLEALARRLSDYPVVIATEVGGGVVPADPAERAAREAAGRLSCLLAQRAQTVVRVFCGIPTVLKGALG